MPTSLAAFVATVALLAMLPGANNASITRQTLMAGRRAGLLAVAGASTGILIWATAAAVGLSAVLLANPGAYLALRIGAAAVLLILGLQCLWALHRGPTAGPAPAGDGRKAATGRGSFAIGVATSLGNPKAGVVAVSLIPQFVTAHRCSPRRSPSARSGRSSPAAGSACTYGSSTRGGPAQPSRPSSDSCTRRPA